MHKYLSLLVIAACVFAVDIYKPGPVMTFTPATDVSTDYIGFSNGYSIDTRIGEPVLPADLRVEENKSGTGYYLIQLNGPIYQAWSDALKSTSLEILTYLPNYTYLVRGTSAQLQNARSLDFVKWTGIYQPAYKVQSGLLDASGKFRVTLQLFPGASVSQISQTLGALGLSSVETIEHELCSTIDVIITSDRIDDVARIPGVEWIQKWSEPVLFNVNSQWVNQTGYRSSTPSPDSVARRSWFKGVRGRGTVLSTSDSGIHTAHYAFYDAAYPITAPGVFPLHRKVVAYKVYSGAAFGDVSAAYWHGTHTAGTTLGNDTLLGTSANDGQSKEARMYFCDIGNASGGLVVGVNLTPMYDTIYLGRGLGYNIYQHSGSWGWGDNDGSYDTQDATTDAYAYKYPRFLSIYAAANAGPGARTIAHPGLSKDVLTIGATGNGTSSNTLASLSSRGPTQDNRIKPNTCAPGVSVVSAQGGTTNTYWSMDGTSMATPNTNGTVGLMRQYLLAGYYPSGIATPADSIKIIYSDILRAMAMVSADPNIGSYVPPEFNAGWGRIDAESVLYYPNETRKLILRSDTIGLATGNFYLDSFQVMSAIPVRVCLAWIDTAAATGAARTLVNNLNLELTNPGGTSYHGNLYTSGQSTANPATWDTINVEECARINAPTTGKWKIYVRAANVPWGPSGYAYAITGDIQRYIIGVEENTSAAVPIEGFTCNTINSGKIRYKVVLSTSGVVESRIFDLSGRIVEQIGVTRLPQGESWVEHKTQLPNGIYFLEIKTSSAHEIAKILIVK